MIVECMLRLLFFFSTCVICNYGLDTGDLVVVILSQDNQYHLKLAETSKYVVQTEAKVLDKEFPVIHLSHIDFSHIGDWTILPLIPKLISLHARNSSWFIFVEDRTEIRLEKLLATLSQHNENKDIWLGYALHDEEATIIHHFAFYQNPTSFKYPNVASGFAMTTKLAHKIADKLKKKPPNSDFSIDSAHELAMFILKEGEGPSLTHEKSFCLINESFCSTFPQTFKPCDNPVPVESLYFAVKTCLKFHNDRIPVVKKTWVVHASKIDFFSDLRNDDIPTIDLGIPNTESGHCGKTMAILKYAAEKLKNDEALQWVILADDDTLFSIPRLRQLLSCYDSTSSMALGERYGYHVFASEGYNYITGGGGIVFSRVLVELLSKPGICECPTISTPDDMYLGICIARLASSLIHSPFFHQARPVDYSKDYLKTQMLVSFHKHWMIDPFFVYKNWLSDVDVPADRSDHTEL